MNQETEVLLRSAITSYKSGDRKTARATLIRILQQDPDSEFAWFLLSYTLLEPDQKNYALRRVLRTNPNNQDAISRLNELTQPEPEETTAKIETSPPSVEDYSHTPPQEALEHHQVGDSASIHPILETDPNRAEPTPHASSTIELIPAPTNRWRSIFSFSKYSLKKAAWLFASVVVGVYITILVANLGGFVDEIFKAEIEFSAGLAARSGPLAELPNEERDAKIQEMIWAMEESMGLHDPFLLRTVRWLIYGLTMNFGEEILTYWMGGVMQGPSGTVQKLVLDRLPFTLLLIGVSNLFVFFLSVFMALFLARRYGSWLDRLSASAASLSSVPSWIIGIILIILLAGQLRILPFPKVIDLEVMSYDRAAFYRLLFIQMLMPAIAIFLSIFFQSVYAWRTFFLIYSQEDYVEMARAKGLSPRQIERRYILKPSMPFVLTSFSLLMITVWEASIALEYLFGWPGVGPLFLNAAHRFNTSLMVAVVIVFAYLLAITIFVLDLGYAIVDPRIRLTHEQQHMNFARPKRPLARRISDFFINISEFFVGMRAALGGIPALFKVPISARLKSLRVSLSAFGSNLWELRRYPSAMVGGSIILVLIGVSIYAIVTIPYQRAVELWIPHASEGGERVWEKYPKNAMPVWVNYFRKEKLPATIHLSTKEGSVEKETEIIGEQMTEILMPFVLEYTADVFPDEIALFFESTFDEKMPHITLTWKTPDGREILLGSFSINQSHILRLAHDEKIQRKLGGVPPQIGLLADPNSEVPVPLKGTYELEVSAIVFEEQADVDTDFVLYGKVFGIAGTDHLRRDLSIALLWGTPVALAFGFIAAIGANLAAMFIAAVSVWYGGWVDNLIQRITDINIILPTLPIAIMVFVMYSKTIWAILGVLVILSIFGTSLKNYRAAFLQAKEAGYIEGAQAYGASGGRIIFFYLLPRIIPVLLPQLVIMVPGFVFYEATLAYLGLSDPYLPTWGKVVYEAITYGAYNGYYYWILEPIALLLITGLAFALLGFSLDRVVNPRLRDL